MDLKLQHIHDPDKNYMIRVCMTVAEAQYVIAGSVVKQCEECGDDIWYAVGQKVPEVDMRIDGTVLLCLPCMLLHQMVDDEPPTWVGPTPWS